MTIKQDRRRFIQGGLGLGLTLGGVPAFANKSGNEPLQANKNRPSVKSLSQQEQLDAYIKLIGSCVDTTHYIAFSGVLWGIAPERTPTPLCGFHGLARNDWLAHDNGKYTKHSFDVGYFSDLDSDQPIKTLINPLTQENVEPFHYKYGGWRTHYSREGTANYDADNKLTPAKPLEFDWQQLGDQVWLTERGVAEVDSTLSPEEWPRESPGEKMYFGSETTYSGSAAQLQDRKISQAEHTLFWSSLAPWESWLLMDGAPGFAMWRGVGAKLKHYSDAPRALLDYVKQEQANYFDQELPWKGSLLNSQRFQNARKPAKKIVK